MLCKIVCVYGRYFGVRYKTVNVLKRKDGKQSVHDDVSKWKHFPRYWPFVLGIHRSSVNSPHEGQWCGALMFSLICSWINGWVFKIWGWWFETPSRSLWRHCNGVLYKTVNVLQCTDGRQSVVRERLLYFFRFWSTYLVRRCCALCGVVVYVVALLQHSIKLTFVSLMYMSYITS